MPASRPTYQWPGIGLLRAGTAPADLAPPADLDPADPGMTRRGAAWLTGVRQHPQLRTALRVASPDLLAALDALDLTRPADIDERRLRRLITATASYLLRWRHRATPFGLFVGVGTVRSAPVTAVRWGDGHQVVRQVDPAWLAETITRLHACPQLLERLTVVTNTAITVRGDRFIAPGPSPSPGGDVDAELAPVEVSVRATRPVRTALDAARTPVRVGDLAKILTSAFPAATPDQINGILAGLIEQNLLISSLHPPMTSPDALGHVCGILRDVAAWDISGLADLTETLCALHRDLATARPPAEPDHATGPLGENTTAGRVPLVVDTVLDADIGLPEQVGAEAARAAAVLCRLSPYPFGTPAWRDYHGRFLARYGTGLPVPVLDLIGDGGLGFPAGYLGSGWGRAPRLFTARDEKLLALVQEAVAEGGELVLTDALVEELADDRDAAVSWPERVEIGVQVLAPSAAAIDRGRFTLLVTGTPRPGSSMAGRHAHHLPEAARADLAATFTTTAPGAIAVQLSFPPRRRRNAPLAAAHPLLDHVLPLAEHPTEDRAGTEVRVVTVDELAVVAEPDRFHLLHQPTGRRVEIRVAHALEATTHIPPLARFLSEIGTARGAFYTAFHFGAADRMPYLPRVRYRRTILASARWLLPATALPGPRSAQKDWEEAFAAWRRRWNVPARVAIVDHDRRLCLDLAQPLHRHLLRTRLSRAPRLELREDVAEHGWIGRAHELLLPLRLTPPSPVPPAWTVPAARTNAAPHRGAEPPGRSTVVFARLLAHPARWDEILTGHVPRLLSGFGEAPRWWFLRHHDLRRPDTAPSLDLYLRLPSPEGYGDAAARLAAWTADLARQNLAASLTLDTFHPQCGQYGHGPALDAAHAVFAADTTAALAQIALSARTGIPATAVTAASMVDLAAALARSRDEGARHLVDNLPQRHGRLDPALRDHALRLTDPTTGLRGLPGGGELITAWQRRADALHAYRTELEAERDPMTVLPVLLRGHHRRAQGVDGEQTTLRLARTCALRHVHQAHR
ncbi:lantibiotic dehydratase [Thermomonospora cellulosilytica]|uniref:Thiopeptide-type bacteriocin biosynthesis protein n=1 Tax=Thermomonospora cellulosilytica TaxID=1411118 RepID=A0A7W3MW05_9ACTN|nr:lantibiotic dehydratase [Thermomonospora cellulosilytica]MBA9002857.1 thiopeptide-type bacteriocin biosynthesis protein [Thermomonospora cellulosilytica]